MVPDNSKTANYRQAQSKDCYKGSCNKVPLKESIIKYIYVKILFNYIILKNGTFEAALK
jgi:hypothetical protein